MDLQPYIFFYGRCLDALEFYKKTLGGTYEASLVKDAPVAGQFPPEMQDGVMHASFTSGGVKFLCSDGRERKAIDPEAGNICLAIAAEDAGEGDRLFAALSAGGTVSMPLGPSFWGPRFGMFVDRFGIEWMFTAP